jgi:hypothetical protein
VLIWEMKVVRKATSCPIKRRVSYGGYGSGRILTPCRWCVQLVNAGMIQGTKIRRTQLGTQPLRFQVDTSGGEHFLQISKIAGAIQIGVLDVSDSVVDVVDTVRATDLTVCTRGALIIVDDMIIPPTLQKRIHAILSNVESGCKTDLTGVPGAIGANAPLDTSQALFTAANINLGTDNVAATVPILAKLNTVAVDGNGNIIPLNADLELDVVATLEEIRRAQSTNVQVQSPNTCQSKFESRRHLCASILHTAQMAK